MRTRLFPVLVAGAATALAWLVLRRLEPPRAAPSPRRATPFPEASPSLPPRPAKAAAATCAATTASGKPCSREAVAGSAFCWQHRERRA